MHSCETGLTFLINNWYNEIDKGNIIGAINIDLCKAFNLVNLDILIFKLQKYGCCNITLSWFESYLRGCSQFVSLSNYDFDFEPIDYGVPQDSILGPLLFILYINDLPVHLDKTHIHMYADDTSLYKSSNLELW